MDEQNKKWIQIFGCAQEILKIKPWKNFNDMDFFELRPYKKERVYVSFLGKQKEVYGLAFYIGSDINMVQEMSDLNSMPFLQRLRYHKCIVCYFDKKEELFVEELELLESLNIKTKDKSKYIHFRAFDPKFVQYMIDKKEIDFLSEIFPVLVNGLNRYYQRELKPMFDFFEVPVYNQSNKGNWSLSIKSLVLTHKPFIFTDPSLYNIDELKKKKQLDLTIEFDIAYINEAFDEPNYKTLHVRIAMIANTETGTMDSYHVVKPDEINSDVYISEFINFIKLHGRPRVCVVRDMEAFESLFYFATLLDIQITISEELFMIDDFIEEMSKYQDTPFSQVS